MLNLCLHFFHHYRKSKLLTQQIAESHTSCHAQRLRQSFSDALTSVRQALVTAKRPSTHHVASLNDHCTTLYTSIKNGLESSLGQLKVNMYILSVLPTLYPAMHGLYCKLFSMHNPCVYVYTQWF